MTRYLRAGLIVCAVVALAALPAQAQGKQKAKKKAPKPVAAEVAAPADVAAEPTAPAPVPENTLELCQDKTDNDGDGHVDCADQDCEVFTLCLPPPMVSPLPPPQPRFVAPAPPPPPAEERGWMCSDGVDNDRDGLTDCFEKSCQSGRRCRREIYYVPEPEDKAPGLIISFGGGLAVPNFRGNDTKGHSDVYGNVPFHPDLGGLLNLSVGVLPVRWFGVGVNLMAGASFGSNRRSWEADEDGHDPTFRDPYKYDSYKGFGHVGGFVRFQWPFDRFVPYLQLSGGYSYARERWWIYNGSESWANIDENDESQLDGTREHDVRVFRHFTAAIEPGFDLFLRKRTFAVGLRAWLPVWANANPDVDNIGVMLNFTFTPMWRERPVMKPEYANPASTLEEETAEQKPEEPKAGPAPAPVPEETAASAEPAPATDAPAAPPAAPDPANEDPYAAPTH
jgi:hypothetical protein